MSGPGVSDRHIGVASDERADPESNDESEVPAELERAVEEMLADRFIDGLVQRFEHLFDEHRTDVEDVVLSEIERLVRIAGPVPRNVRAVLTWRVRKRMLDVKRRSQIVHFEVLDDDEAARDEDSPERRAVRREMYDEIKALIRAWENRMMALVVNLTLEAAFFDEVLEVDDIKEIVFEQLGHSLTTANVWKLRSRGLKRLATEIVEILGDDLADFGIDVADNNDGATQEEDEDDE